MKEEHRPNQQECATREGFAALLALLILALVPIAPACAQPIPADTQSARADWLTIDRCLTESGAFPRSCIGSVAVVCETRQRSRDRAEAETACNLREAAVWRERLATAVTLLQQRLDQGQRDRFAALQRDWDRYIVNRCGLAGGRQNGREGEVARSRCELSQTAGRAIEVDGFARSSDPAAAINR